MQEKFTIKCNICGSDNVVIKKEFDYDVLVERVMEMVEDYT